MSSVERSDIMNLPILNGSEQTHGGASVEVDVQAIVGVLSGGAKTSREIAKVLGVHKHDVNTVIYKNLDVFTRANAESKPVPLWILWEDEMGRVEDEPDECIGCGKKVWDEDDYGNNADVSDTCCKACWDKEMGKTEEEEEIERLTKKVAEMQAEVDKWNMPSYTWTDEEKTDDGGAGEGGVMPNNEAVWTFEFDKGGKNRPPAWTAYRVCDDGFVRKVGHLTEHDDRPVMWDTGNKLVYKGDVNHREGKGGKGKGADLIPEAQLPDRLRPSWEKFKAKVL